MARPKSRRAFLEQRLQAMLDDLDKAKEDECWTAVAQLHRTIGAFRKELDVELAKLETKERKAPTALADQVALIRKQFEALPDQLLVVGVEVWCARYKLALPRPLKKVGG